ncbi:MAG: GIY-YIG nuclease family protein [Leptolyngbyaceae cyanobacterium]
MVLLVIVRFDCAQPTSDRSLSGAEANARTNNHAHTYILECVDDSFYTGSTWNLEQRLWQHQQGLGARYTAK